MSKICIIGNSNIKHISLISLYTKFFDDNKIPYDLIYIDRYSEKESTTAQNCYVFRSGMLNNKIKKIYMFYKFRRFVVRALKKNQYDFIIVWQATTAYVISDYLCKYYKNRFSVNIRDYIMENKPIIRFVLKKLLKKAAFITISSKGFLRFLPKHDYILVHSINERLLNNYKPSSHSKNDLIKIGFVGNCRFFDECYKLIDAIGNDKRFEIWFCGTNSEVLSKYADKNRIKNVYTIEAFEPNETLEIMKRFDLINCAFGNNYLSVKTLVPIRLYTSIEMRKPVLVSGDTYLAELVESSNLGYVISGYNGLGDKLYSYLKELDYQSFYQSCESFIKQAREDNRLFYSCLEHYTNKYHLDGE